MFLGKRVPTKQLNDAASGSPYIYVRLCTMEGDVTSYSISNGLVQANIESLELPLRCFDHGCAGRTFSSKGNYQRHLKEKNGASVKFLCPTCGRSFSRSTARNTHSLQGRCFRSRRSVPLYQAPFILPGMSFSGAPVHGLKTNPAAHNRETGDAVDHTSGIPFSTSGGTGSVAGSNGLMLDFPADGHTALPNCSMDPGPPSPTTMGTGIPFDLSTQLAAASLWQQSAPRDPVRVANADLGLNLPLSDHGVANNNSFSFEPAASTGTGIDIPDCDTPSTATRVSQTSPATTANSEPSRSNHVPHSPASWSSSGTCAEREVQRQQQGQSASGVLIRCYDHGCQGRSFSTIGNYRRHMKEQNGGSPLFVCEICDKTFSRSTARRLHEQRVH